jgi:hypothetical protein
MDGLSQNWVSVGACHFLATFHLLFAPAQKQDGRDLEMKMKTLAILAAILSIMAGTTDAEARRANKAHSGHRTASTERATHRETSGWGWFSGWDTASTERTPRAPRAHRSAERSSQRTAERSSYRAATTSSFFSGARTASVGGHDAGPRPAKWCGWYMRTQLGGGAEYNVAANWRNYGRPASPQVGAVVVWPHHVGMITGRSANGQWIVKSGNYSGGVREVPMSVAGAAIRM